MSLSAFIQQYIKPTRWWRRQRTLQITIWPKFLAQALCPHLTKQLISWDVEKKTFTRMCLDCHKWIEEANDCAHGEVRIHAVETVNIGQGRRSAQLIPRSFLCEHCGVELDAQNLPPGVKVGHLDTMENL